MAETRVSRTESSQEAAWKLAPEGFSEADSRAEGLPGMGGEHSRSWKWAGQAPDCEDTGPKGWEKCVERRKNIGEDIRFDLGTGDLGGWSRGKIKGT